MFIFTTLKTLNTLAQLVLVTLVTHLMLFSILVVLTFGLILNNVKIQDAYNITNMIVLNTRLSTSLDMILKFNSEQVSSAEKSTKTLSSSTKSKSLTKTLLKSKKKWVKYLSIPTLMVLSVLLSQKWLLMDSTQCSITSWNKVLLIEMSFRSITVEKMVDMTPKWLSVGSKKIFIKEKLNIIQSFTNIIGLLKLMISYSVINLSVSVIHNKGVKLLPILVLLF